MEECFPQRGKGAKKQRSKEEDYFHFAPLREIFLEYRGLEFRKLKSPRGGQVFDTVSFFEFCE